jgi:hypothetical protein
MFSPPTLPALCHCSVIQCTRFNDGACCLLVFSRLSQTQNPENGLSQLYPQSSSSVYTISLAIGVRCMCSPPLSSSVVCARRRLFAPSNSAAVGLVCASGYPSTPGYCAVFAVSSGAAALPIIGIGLSNERGGTDALSSMSCARPAGGGFCLKLATSGNSMGLHVSSREGVQSVRSHSMHT